MFKKILSFAGWALLLSVMLIGCLLLTAWQGWSLYYALFFWLALLLATILMRAIWVALIPWVARGKLKRLFPSARYSRLEQVLFEQWKSGASVIKRVSRRNGEIPWFVMMGERCGKTTLMAGSGLPLFSHQPENNVVVPTRTLRWWFFKTACFLDCSSYFLQGKPVAKQGWQRLTRWCRRLPAPSGVVIVISCRDLQNRSALELHQHARILRVQLETLMKSVNRKLPFYVVVTQCDQISGFTLWSSKLSAAQRRQALGYHWRKAPVADRRDLTLLDPLFSALRTGTGLSRLGMLSGELSAGETAMLLDLPGRLDALQLPLHHYIAALSEPDAYFSTGALGGIWLTACTENVVHSPQRDALFVQDLILSRLPDINRSTRPEAFGRVQQWFNLRGKALFTAAAACALLFSAWQTAALLSPADSQDAAVLTARLEMNEKWREQPLRYLPFVSLLKYRHVQIERALFDTAGARPQPIENLMESYRESFYAASPQQQRQIILQLAETILTWQAMAQGEKLSVLATRPSLPPVFSSSGATPLIQLAITRARVRLNGDGGGITTLQQTLHEFVSSDSQWRWLVAEDPTLGGLPITRFWPHSAKKTSLSGIWQSAGSEKIAAQLDLIEQAMGGEKASVPALAEFRQFWPVKQQEAWLAFLLLLAKEEPLSAGTLASSAQLMALIQGNDPASTFIRLLIGELAAIPVYEAQPWLTEARRLHRLQHLPESLSLIDLWDDREKNTRRWLRAWLQGQPAEIRRETADLQAWGDWRTALHETVNQMMVVGKESAQLTAGLFGEPQPDGINPLNRLYAQYVQLRAQLENPGNNIGRGAVWALLESQMRLLTSHAMATSACWLETQWHNSVLSPLAHRAEYRDPAAQQEALWRYLTDFVREAQPVLHLSSSGLQAGEFEGYRIPFAPQFLNLINHVIDPDALRVMPERAQTLTHDALSVIDEKRAELDAEQTALIKKLTIVKVTSLPATIPGGARLMPVGTQLALHCEDKTWRLDSQNLLTEAEFRSAPAQCSAVNLTIQFPGFDLTHHYLGDNAWNDFLTDFDSGERRFTPDEFSSEGRSWLESTGIHEILVRYRLQGQQTVFRQWQRWQSLNEEIAALENLRDEHQQQQRERQQPRYLMGKLAELPTSVAICRQ
jgi:type VI secretion system protein ImpL